MGIKCFSASSRVSHFTPGLSLPSTTSSHLWCLPITTTSQTPWRQPIHLRNSLGPGATNGGQDTLKQRVPQGQQERAGIQDSSAGNPGEPNREPDVAASCSAPLLRQGGSRGRLRKPGAGFRGPHLGVGVGVGSVTPRGGVTGFLPA